MQVTEICVFSEASVLDKIVVCKNSGGSVFVDAVCGGK
jgi:hypothetical protein